MYGFGGASGSVFGASWLGIQQELITRVGVWNNEDIDTSSNHREYRNNVESLETAGERGELQGREFFFFTHPRGGFMKWYNYTTFFYCSTIFFNRI